MIPRETITVEKKNVVGELRKRENDYTNPKNFVMFPSTPDSIVNSKDYIDMNFDIPKSVYDATDEEQIFFDMFFACGEKLDAKIEGYNRFGVLEDLQAVKCNEAWEDKHIKLRLEKPVVNKINLVFRKLPGNGRAKIDSTSIYIKKEKFEG